MKTKLTPELKAKFFAQYWGQKVFKYEMLDKLRSKFLSLDDDHLSDDDYLILKPLSSISDEDAIEVAKISDVVPDEGLLVERRSRGSVFVYCKYNDTAHTNKPENLFVIPANDLAFYCYSDSGKIYNVDAERALDMFDLLRSKSYAIPFMGISVEEMIEAGWIKLKD